MWVFKFTSFEKAQTEVYVWNWFLISESIYFFEYIFIKQIVNVLCLGKNKEVDHLILWLKNPMTQEKECYYFMARAHLSLCNYVK